MIQKFLIISIALLLTGCAARREARPKIGAPPILKGGQWTCANDHYRYNPLTTLCELDN